MRVDWPVLAISALTDFAITAATGVTTSISTAAAITGRFEMPTEAVWLLAIMGGVMSSARTVQQMMKAVQAASNLAGEQPPRV